MYNESMKTDKSTGIMLWLTAYITLGSLAVGTLVARQPDEQRYEHILLIDQRLVLQPVGAHHVAMVRRVDDDGLVSQAALFQGVQNAPQ